MTSRPQRLSPSDLYGYQKLMISHILEHEKCALWVDMGLGKTVATLTALQQLRDDYAISRTLVVAPPRVAESVWPHEPHRWSHLSDLTVEPMVGNARERLEAMNRDRDVHTISRDSLSWLVDLFSVSGRAVRWPWDCVVLDESSGFKQRNTNRWKSIARVGSRIHRMIQLTGTPQPNSIEDLWSQVYLLDGGARLGRTLTAFRNRWIVNNPYSYKKAPRPGAHGELKRLTSDIALSLRAEDYLDLPGMVENDVEVQLKRSQMEKYLELKRQYILEMDTGETVNAASAGVLWNKLAQLANGTVYDEDGKAVNFHDHKVNALQEVHESLSGQAIIAYTYRHDLARIGAMLDKAGAKWRIMKNKNDEDEWNAGRLDRLVLHPASAGHGLNLHLGGCRDIIWHGLTPNLEHYQQANARIAGGHRGAHGDRPVVAHRIVTKGTQDMDLAALLGRKSASQRDLMTITKRMIRQEKRHAQAQ